MANGWGGAAGGGREGTRAKRLAELSSQTWHPSSPRRVLVYQMGLNSLAPARVFLKTEVPGRALRNKIQRGRR